MAVFSGVSATILLVWEIPTAAKYFAWVSLFPYDVVGENRN